MSRIRQLDRLSRARFSPFIALIALTNLVRGGRGDGETATRETAFPHLKVRGGRGDGETGRRGNGILPFQGSEVERFAGSHVRRFGY